MKRMANSLWMRALLLGFAPSRVGYSSSGGKLNRVNGKLNRVKVNRSAGNDEWT